MYRLDPSSLSQTLITCAGVATVVTVVWASSYKAEPASAVPQSQSQPTQDGSAINDYDLTARTLTEQEKLGRDTWNFWTAGTRSSGGRLPVSRRATWIC